MLVRMSGRLYCLRNKRRCEKHWEGLAYELKQPIPPCFLRNRHWAARSEGLTGKVEPEKFKTFKLME